MAFPTASVTTTNLDAGTDDPSLARADLLDGSTETKHNYRRRRRCKRRSTT